MTTVLHYRLQYVPGVSPLEQQMFVAMVDLDGDGALSLEELTAAMEAAGGAQDIVSGGPPPPPPGQAAAPIVPGACGRGCRELAAHHHAAYIVIVA